MTEEIKLALEYGLGGLALFGVVSLGYISFKLEKRILKTEDTTKTTNEKCEVRKEYFGKIFDSIDTLEMHDVKGDGRFDNIDTKLENLANGQNDIKNDVRSIVNYFAQQGMGK